MPYLVFVKIQAVRVLVNYSVHKIKERTGKSVLSLIPLKSERKRKRKTTLVSFPRFGPSIREMITVQQTTYTIKLKSLSWVVLYGASTQLSFKIMQQSDIERI